MKTHIIIVEYDRLYPADNNNIAGSSIAKKHYIDAKSFEALKIFVSYEENHQYLDVIQGGRALQAKQFVGVIETKSGTIVEILPKIAVNNKGSIRKIFLKMLRRLKHSPFKHLNSAHLNTDKMHLLEIFIAMFNEELSQLIKKGIVSDYITIEENAPFIKGKIKLKEQLQQNVLHQERFFIAYDSYESNRIENRLIKSTIEYLIKKTNSTENKKRLREFMFVFETVKSADDPNNDFAQITNNRQMKHYESILQWCQIFLNNRSFISFKGDEIAYALLFDMNKIFEDYVAYEMKKQYPQLHVKTQHTSQHLLIAPSNLFKLRPDLIIGDNAIGDTKWKIVKENERRYGISQSDLYQMFAYGKKYEREELYLIYPKSDGFMKSQKIPFKFEENMPLQLLCFDCEKGTLIGEFDDFN